MNIQRKNSAHHFRMQSEREQTLVDAFSGKKSIFAKPAIRPFFLNPVTYVLIMYFAGCL